MLGDSKTLESLNDEKQLMRFSARGCLEDTKKVPSRDER